MYLLQIGLKGFQRDSIKNCFSVFYGLIVFGLLGGRRDGELGDDSGQCPVFRFKSFILTLQHLELLLLNTQPRVVVEEKKKER